MNKVIYLLSLLLATSFALYDSRSKVQLLTPQTFKEKVLNSKSLWIVEFFAPWCGHCKALAPEYEKAAKTLEGIVNIAAVDADAHKDLGGQYGIQGFPTIKFFGDNKNSPSDYQGERSAQAIINFALEQVKSTVNGRQKGSSSNRNQQKQSSGSSSGSGSGSADDVIVLTDSTFDENVLKSKDSWFVEFYAPWCGHCKKLEPEWNKVGSELKGKVKVAKIDATANTQLASRFGVSGYPTLKFFPAGFSNDSDAIPYDGARDSSAMIEFALEQSNKSKKVEVVELLSKDVLTENCIDYNGVCIIAFLPHIYDSNKQERNQYINQLLDVAKSLKNKPVNFLWTQGGDNYEFEEAFQCAAAHPSVMALSGRKSVYAKLKGAFSKQNIEQFVNNVLNGREHFNQYSRLPNFKKVEKWDGQDHKPVYNDEF
ncbi:unnamed protein product [Paramecium pentaurelia]|uniref:protein disulfide-isomerase n=1 Tax=Paramecium pentaurelia TaxID=43138 RepID=A0A8S1S377_9CILI|nr:unnamed protein product [Paramecium pentaurelia]